MPQPPEKEEKRNQRIKGSKIVSFLFSRQWLNDGQISWTELWWWIMSCTNPVDSGWSHGSPLLSTSSDDSKSNGWQPSKKSKENLFLKKTQVSPVVSIIIIIIFVCGGGMWTRVCHPRTVSAYHRPVFFSPKKGKMVKWNQFLSPTAVIHTQRPNVDRRPPTHGRKSSELVVESLATHTHTKIALKPMSFVVVFPWIFYFLYFLLNKKKNRKRKERGRCF